LEGAEGDRANRVLDDFVERSWFSESTLRFYRKRDEDQARDYLWLLTALGIPARSIELIVYDRRKPRASKAYWRRVLGTPRKPVALLQPENTEVENLHLGIRATLELQDGLQQNRHSGAALRYLLLMASIDWHFRA